MSPRVTSGIGSLPTQMRDKCRLYSTPRLRGPNGEKFGYTMGLMTDLLLEKARQAAAIRIPGQGDPTQLPYLANDRLLDQGPSETNQQFTARLTQAFPTWKKAGSRLSVLAQLQAYATNMQTGVTVGTPQFAIVGGGPSLLGFSPQANWDILYNGAAQGTPPVHVQGTNGWNWDGVLKPWRSWLIMYLSRVATGQSGAGAAVGTPFGNAGDTGHNVGGVWVTNTANTLNTPFVRITGLSGMTVANIYDWMTFSGSSHAANNGSFQIVDVPDSVSCTIANPSAVGSDSGLTWSVSHYPWIGPGPVWGSPNSTFGAGANPLPPADTGSTVNGVWQPTTSEDAYALTSSWGLTCTPQTIDAIRKIVSRWKGAGAYYPNFIVAFDGGDGTAGTAFSPYSTSGSGLPDGSFGHGEGRSVAGVWQPTRLVSSPFDCYCVGTGYRSACTVENKT